MDDFFVYDPRTPSHSPMSLLKDDILINTTYTSNRNIWYAIVAASFDLTTYIIWISNHYLTHHTNVSTILLQTWSYIYAEAIVILHDCENYILNSKHPIESVVISPSDLSYFVYLI